MATASASISFLTQKDAIAIDQELFNDYAFSVDQLMELAGLSCAHAIAHTYKKGRVVIVVGPGNNGGDGLVCARHLKLLGFQPSIYYPKQSSSDLMKRLVTQTSKMDVPYLADESFQASELAKNYSVIVDALFGFSFKPPLRPPFDRVISTIAKSSVPVFSVDIPSGWDVEKGPLNEVPSVNPDVLISLTAPKLCARHFKGKSHFLGGRFVPDAIAKKYNLRLPEYADVDCIVKL